MFGTYSSIPHVSTVCFVGGKGGENYATNGKYLATNFSSVSWVFCVKVRMHTLIFS